MTLVHIALFLDVKDIRRSLGLIAREWVHMLDEMSFVGTVGQPRELNVTRQVAKSGTVGRFIPTIGTLIARNPGPSNRISQIMRIVVRVVDANPVAFSSIAALVIHNNGWIIRVIAHGARRHITSAIWLVCRGIGCRLVCWVGTWFMRKWCRIRLVRRGSWVRMTIHTLLHTFLDPKLLTFSNSRVGRLSLANQEHLVRSFSQWPRSSTWVLEHHKAVFSDIVTMLTTANKLPRSFLHRQRSSIHIAGINSNPIIWFWVALVEVDFNCFPLAVAIVVCVNYIVTIRMGHWLIRWIRRWLVGWVGSWSYDRLWCWLQ